MDKICQGLELSECEYDELRKQYEKPLIIRKTLNENTLEEWEYVYDVDETYKVYIRGRFMAKFWSEMVEFPSHELTTTHKHIIQLWHDKCKKPLKVEKFHFTAIYDGKKINVTAYCPFKDLEHVDDDVMQCRSCHKYHIKNDKLLKDLGMNARPYCIPLNYAYIKDIKYSRDDRKRFMERICQQKEIDYETYRYLYACDVEYINVTLKLLCRDFKDENIARPLFITWTGQGYNYNYKVIPDEESKTSEFFTKVLGEQHGINFNPILDENLKEKEVDYTKATCPLCHDHTIIPPDDHTKSYLKERGMYNILQPSMGLGLENLVL